MSADLSKRLEQDAAPHQLAVLDEETRHVDFDAQGAAKGEVVDVVCQWCEPGGYQSVSSMWEHRRQS
ncbi:hypothetical protein ACFV3R_25680 [Streptomyces sp. NPDC059740]|uniref:hypothetical protein n=1 Tax=Streptomyces sp. NPDC059740 TaxID=3346926 RepID=UPI003648420A